MDRLFDTIKLENGTELVGVIDNIGDKFIHFVDFTNETYEHALYMIIRWKAERASERFSVFCLETLSESSIPPIKSINKKAILDPPFDKTKQKKIKKKKSIKLSAH